MPTAQMPARVRRVRSRRLPFSSLTAGLCGLATIAAAADAVVSGVTPATVAARGPAVVTLTGRELGGDLRAFVLETGMPLRIESVAPAAATATLPPTAAAIGPIGLLPVTRGGPGPILPVIVDDLPPVPAAGANTSRAAAEPIQPPVCVDGTTAPGLADCYRLTVDRGQRLAIEVVARQAGSTLDPVVRLLDDTGRLLAAADDRPDGLDCRLAHTFAAGGTAVLELRHGAHVGSHRYHLRIGDFPLVGHAWPLAVRRGSVTRVGFGGPDGDAAEPADVAVAADAAARGLSVAARLPGGRAAAWVRLLVHDAPQVVEGGTGTLPIPVGVSGRLAAPGECDVHAFAGAKDMRLLVTTRARSLGCGTVPRVRVLDAAGKPVAETPVSEADEPQLAVTLPADGEYRLEIDDLARRGGADFGYHFALEPDPGVAASLKPDPRTRDAFAVEPRNGCAAVDLVFKRAGYDGPLTVSLVGAAAGLRIENPTVPAKATEARILVAAADGWREDSLALVRLEARPEGPATAIPVTSVALRRARAAADAYPHPATDGLLVMAGVPGGAARFALEPPATVRLTRTGGTHSIPLAVTRLDPQFSGPVTISGCLLPPGFAVTAKTEKDTCLLTLTGSAAVGDEPATLRLLALAETGNRVTVERVDLPVAWVDAAAPEGPAAAAGQAPPSPADAAAGSSAAGAPAGGPLPEPAAPAAAVDGAPSVPGQLEVHPRRVVLTAANDRQQLAVTCPEDGGLSRDVTVMATIDSSDTAIAAVEGSRVVPRGDGAATLLVEWQGRRTTVPVVVTGAAVARPIGFGSDLMPALSKQTCSSGACHGSPSGKGGFRLSLRAADRQLDELTILREESGRRVDPLDPDASLLLLKPLMRVPHGGGRQLATGDAAFAVIRGWIAAGARPDPPDAPGCVRLEAGPPGRHVQRLAAGPRQLVVTAWYADGTRRDVTHLAAYETAAAAVAVVDPHGRVTPRGRGETVILVRYLDQLAIVPLVFLDTPEGFAWRPPPEHNWIDGLVDARLRELGYQPAPPCGDSEFVRRVHLDLTGLLPTVEETRVFLADTSADKRARLVDRLLERDECARFQALAWGDLLRITRKRAGDDGVHKYHRWVEDALRANMPHDRFVRSLLLGAGSTFGNPPAAFYRTAADTGETVETVAQVFLGVRLQCAKCHSHPFDRWSQDDYHGLAAFFDRVRRRATQLPGESFIFTATAGETVNPRTGRAVKPWLPGRGGIDLPAEADRREAFAAWLLAPDNPFFARVEANRIWSRFFARGIVDPVDDFRDSNPPSNPALLDALARDFAAGGFDRRRLMRTILASRTYQASAAATPENRDDVACFSRQLPRPLAAEQLLDAIGGVTGIPQVFPNVMAGTRATQLPAPDVAPLEFLTTFGQPPRDTVCACERPDASTLGMAIELGNGRLVQQRLAAPENRFRRALAAGRSVADVVEELYLAAFSRPPAPDELAAALEQVRRAGDPATGLEDVCWAILNADEFVFQH